MDNWDEKTTVAFKDGKRINVYAGLFHTYLVNDGRYYSSSGKIHYVTLKSAKELAFREKIDFVHMSYHRGVLGAYIFKK